MPPVLSDVMPSPMVLLFLRQESSTKKFKGLNSSLLNMRSHDLHALLDNVEPLLSIDDVDCIYKYILATLNKKNDLLRSASIELGMECYISKNDATECVLGIPLNIIVVRDGRISTVETFSDYLSSYSFYESNVRSSSYRSDINAWIPIPINKTHWQRASLTIPDSLNNIKDIIGMGGGMGPIAPSDLNWEYFNLIIKIMNMIIVTKSKSVGPFTGADHRACTSIYHLLMYLVKGCNGLARHLEQDAMDFYFHKEHRHKKNTADIGEFLIKSSFSHLRWDEIGNVVIEEAMIRLVKTFVSEDPVLDILPSQLEPDEYVDRAFRATKTNRDVICMHSLLYHQFNLQSGDSTLDDSFGIPTDNTLRELSTKWALVQSMSNFNDFFRIMGFQPPPNMFLYLTNAVYISVKVAKYHYRSWGYYERNRY